MFCQNCGKKINDNDRFCSECGKEIKNLTKEDNGDINKKANLLCILSIIFTSLPFLIQRLCYIFNTNYMESFISNIGTFSSLVGLVLMVYVRVKFPKNLFGKILMWLYIIGSIALIIYIIIVFVLFAYFFTSCLGAIESCPG